MRDSQVDGAPTVRATAGSGSGSRTTSFDSILGYAKVRIKSQTRPKTMIPQPMRSM